MKLIALACVLVLVTAAVAPLQAQAPADVTLLQLIANPQVFDGKLVRVIGFLRLEFEGNVLYLHREDYIHSLLGNGVWIDVNPVVAKQKATLDMNYVLIEGVFDSHDRGHMGMWSGSITKIQRADLWSEIKHPRASPQGAH